MGSPANLVILRATGGEAEEAGGHAFGGESPHLAMSDGVVLTLGTLLAHHVQTQRRMSTCAAISMSFAPSSAGYSRASSSSTTGLRAALCRGCPRPLHQLHESLVVGVVHGTNPTPQLPNTTVVTSCHDDGCIVAQVA